MIDLNQILFKAALEMPALLIRLWGIWLPCAILFAMKLAYRIWQRRRLAASGMDEIDRMDGRTFERYLEAIFLKQGYRVELTPYTGDYGGDLVLQRDGVRTLVQAKRYSKSVGVSAVQEAAAAKAMYRCMTAMVITNSTFTNQAAVLARANEVILWDRSRLVSELLAARKSDAFVASSTETVAASAPTVTLVGSEDAATPECPACSVPMTLRKAKRGAKAGSSFWGCSNFPNCRQIVDLS